MATRTRNSISAAWTSAFKKNPTALTAPRTLIQDQSIQRTFFASAQQRKQGGAVSGWPQDPASKTASQSSCDPISSTEQSQQRFERHLKFLAGSWKNRLKQSSTPLSPSKWQITSASELFDQQHSDETANSTDVKIKTITPSETKKWKRFRPGFQSGDFICPQCGSHNFRPPEHDMAALANSATYIKRQQPEQGDNVRTLSSESSSLDMEDEGNVDTTTTSTPDRLRDTVTEQQKPTRYQVRTVPKRKYPLGASARCFECGFETSYTTPATPTSAKISPSLSTEQGKNMEIDKDKDNDNDAGRPTSRTSAFYSGSADPLRSDIRISKPKNYICPQCQTVNFNNRLHCVGCGVLAPWIRGVVERGIKDHHHGDRSASGRKGRTRAKCRQI